MKRPHTIRHDKLLYIIELHMIVLMVQIYMDINYTTVIFIILLIIIKAIIKITVMVVIISEAASSGERVLAPLRH